MIDKLVTIVFVCCAAVGIAQQKDGKGAGTPAKPEPVKIDYHQPGTEMPRVKLVSIDTLEKVLEGKDLKKAKKKYMKEFGYTPVTKVYTDNELDNGASIFMMMFNPTCGHCEAMADKLEKNLKDFKNSTLVMICTPQNKEYLPAFIKNHKVKDYFPSVLIGIDSSGFIDNTYLYSSLPQISIYSKDRKLEKMYNGEISMDSLVKFVN